MTKHYDVIVVGAGSMGMAAGYFLAKEGVKTLLIDSFNPPHAMGSHFGDTRIIRHAYGEGRGYVPLALRSQELWEDLERKTHHKIFMQVGNMGFGPEGNSPFIDEAIASGKEWNLDVEYLNGQQLSQRFPGLTLPEDYIAHYEKNSGFIFSENAIQAYKELAIHHGAETSFDNRVTDIEAHENSVTVTTEKGTFTGDKLILTPGAWLPKIAKSIGLDLPIFPTRQAIGWFTANTKLFNSNAFPTFMVEVPTDDGERAIYYGFPAFDGYGLKIGRHDYEDHIDPDTINREFGFSEHDEGHLREFLSKFMPEANGELEKAAICMYSRTPDGHFIIDKHPEHDHISFAGGFSGHGFKFASAVGEIMAQLATKGETEHDISLFKLDRPALKEKAVQ